MKNKNKRKPKLTRKKKKETNKKAMRESIKNMSKMGENQQEMQNIMKTQLEDIQNIMKAQEKCLDRFYDEYDFMKKYKKDAREDVKN